MVLEDSPMRDSHAKSLICVAIALTLTIADYCIPATTEMSPTNCLSHVWFSGSPWTRTGVKCNRNIERIRNCTKAVLVQIELLAIG